MNLELRKIIVNQFTGWAETWGISLAFAVTQSVEKAEKIIADATVALVAAEAEREWNASPSLAPSFESNATNALRLANGPAGASANDSKQKNRSTNFNALQLPSSVNAARFAAVVWELANAQAYRGFGNDTFFKMPAVTRAIVVLKTKAQFSRHQIAAALHLKLLQVDDHLENARLLFSDGRSWIQGSPGIQVTGDRWVPDCPQWAATAPRNDSLDTNIDDIQTVFANYVGNDLDVEAGRKLHEHLVVCSTCRVSFVHFKKQYADWTASVPTIDTDLNLRKSLTKMSQTAFKVRRRAAPSIWPGLRKVLRDAQVRAMILGAVTILLLRYWMQHRK